MRPRIIPTIFRLRPYPAFWLGIFLSSKSSFSVRWSCSRTCRRRIRITLVSKHNAVISIRNIDLRVYGFGLSAHRWTWFSAIIDEWIVVWKIRRPFRRLLYIWFPRSAPKKVDSWHFLFFFWFLLSSVYRLFSWLKPCSPRHIIVKQKARFEATKGIISLMFFLYFLILPMILSSISLCITMNILQRSVSYVGSGMVLGGVYHDITFTQSLSLFLFVTENYFWLNLSLYVLIKGLYTQNLYIMRYI